MTRSSPRGRVLRSRRASRGRARVAIACALSLAGAVAMVPASAQTDASPLDAAPSDTAPSDTAPSNDSPSDTAPAGAAAAPPLQAPATPLLTELPPSWPDAPQTEAEAWVLTETATGQVLAGNTERERRPVASTVKVLTALTVVRRSELDEVVTIGEEVTGIIGASIELVPGDELTVGQLLVGMLVRSGNDAAEALAAHVGGDLAGFLDLMRQDAAALGLEVTGADAVRLESVSGLGDGNRLSAHDLAVIARAALDDPDLRPLLAATDATLPRVGTDENRNLLIGSYPGATGVKTGFTQAAGNSLIGSAVRGDRELVVVVLDAGDDPARFSQAATLLDHGFETFTVTDVVERRSLLVAGGRRHLEVAAPSVTVPREVPLAVDVTLPPRVDGHTGPPATLRLDDVAVATLPASLTGDPPDPVDGAARVGRGAVDGLHAALRATLDDPDSDPDIR